MLGSKLLGQLPMLELSQHRVMTFVEYEMLETHNSVRTIAQHAMSCLKDDWKKDT